ncbi:2-dehydropantoate 2-reductase [Halalkalibacter krulwichiae]|uniref:2-dehydropantoate 2-reductase n=1 Tax=Halalkalibacter krulwichiae TaxID=199441 RepID=A0A1X9MCC6_9BACI|nr:2-dehydropantoate 2-reductase [Halalkalibacter krulwichiae]ARK31105.1 putative 2-dehydropantoate 2-reductase [Halalkalibacter krulwichiae]
MEVAIIGSGSIGMLVTYYLSTIKNQPISVFTNRQGQTDLINENGIKIIRGSEEAISKNIRATRVDSISVDREIDLLILTVKSYQVEDVLKQLSERNVKVNSILFMQNGMGHIEYFPKLEVAEIAVAVVEHGAIRKNDFTVHHTGIGAIRWSYVQKGTLIIENFFEYCFPSYFAVQHESSWEELLQKKLVVNACINSLTSLMEVKNGALIANKNCYSMLKMVFNEVMVALNVEDTTQHWNYVLEVCEKTANNKSSMFIDVTNNRKTEVDSIIGYLIRRAQESKVELSILPFLFQAIQAKEGKGE